MSVPAYPEYKDSGVAWLGDVPVHWQVERITNLYREVADAGNDDLPILSVSIHSGVSDDELADDEVERKVSRSDDRSKYKQVQRNDLVYNMMRAWQGGFGAVLVPGMVSPAYVVARPRGDVPSRYVELLLRTSGAVEEMRRRSRGVTDFRLRLYWDEFKDMRIALPPSPERRDIVAFLDRETAKIDGLVAEQERLIALLKEKRQAVISHAVTKGLNPNAPMKDSGIAWLGLIPAHWTATPLKYLVTFRSGGTPSKENLDFWNGDIPWASAKDLKMDVLDDTLDHLTKLAIDTGAATLLPAEVVIVLVRGMMLARMFPVCEIGMPMTINQDLKALLPGPRIDTSFLAWLLRGTADETLNRLDEAGHGTKALRMESWTSMELPLPSLDEQREVAAYLGATTKTIDDLIGQAQSAITLLQERRAALVSAAVTGKIDVRTAVVREAELATT